MEKVFVVVSPEEAVLYGAFSSRAKAIDALGDYCDLLGESIHVGIKKVELDAPFRERQI